MQTIASYFPITDPTLIFFVVLIIILFAPIIMGKLRIPHIIGMVLAGVLVGKYGLNILERDASFELFGSVGLYYIMFLASLELDLDGLRRHLGRTVAFGLLSFAIPLLMTVVASTTLLGYGLTASMLLACIMSSNTLVAYPIISRYGLQRKPSVTLSVGGTMVSLLLALITLAIIVQNCQEQSGGIYWLWFALRFGLYCAGLLWIMPRLTRWFLRSYSDAVMQFIFVMAMLFMSAALAEVVGLEGIFGAFYSGLIMNRYIPHVSPLMNRIEFIGNAIFIPYFLIGVGMLINIRVLFEGGFIIAIVAAITAFGTFGKAAAAYLGGYIFRLPLSSGHMMFGLTSAHAAGAIAMVMVGMKLKGADGGSVITEEMLNGVVIMILFTCIISSIVTEWAARSITLRDNEILDREDNQQAGVKVLVPVKYPEYADRLIQLTALMLPSKNTKGIVGLNVVYDDENMRANQEKGRRLLEQISRQAAASDIPIETQVRIAANIANGIKHAFKEFQCTEIIIGMHTHLEVSTRFWGQFHQSLFNGLNHQIIMARLNQPLSTLRRIEVAVPSKAQYEPGFRQWVERLARMTENLECRIVFHGRVDTLQHVNAYIRNHHPNVRAEYREMAHWNAMPELASTIAQDHLFVVVTARKGTVSYKSAQERLPEELTRYFSGKNLLIIFPDQYGEDKTLSMTFAEPQHQEELSAYDTLRGWFQKHRKDIGAQANRLLTATTKITKKSANSKDNADKQQQEKSKLN
ncbi:MAG: cation:proton antiporter [Prevotella sp.]|jgi:Kef-type K+ transport system membrane component KefB